MPAERIYSDEALLVHVSSSDVEGIRPVEHVRAAVRGARPEDDKLAFPDQTRVRSVGFPLEHPCWDPVGHGLVSCPVGDLVGDQAPPVALLADAPARQPTVDDRVHLQSGRVVAAGTMWLTGKQRGQIDEHREGRIHAAERLFYGLPVVAD